MSTLDICDDIFLMNSDALGVPAICFFDAILSNRLDVLFLIKVWIPLQQLGDHREQRRQTVRLFSLQQAP